MQCVHERGGKSRQFGSKLLDQRNDGLLFILREPDPQSGGCYTGAVGGGCRSNPTRSSLDGKTSIARSRERVPEAGISTDLPVTIRLTERFMNTRVALSTLAALLLSMLAVATAPSDYSVAPVPHAQVEITDSFWAAKIDVNRTVSIQHVLRKYAETGRFDNGRMIEAAAYMLAQRKDPALEQQIDELIARAVSSIEDRGANPERLLGVGYLLEAGVDYFGATGDRWLLEASIKAADALDAAYGPGKKTHISGHQGLKIGLMKLYRETGDERYWKLAKFFMDQRGRDDYPRQGEYAIDRTYAQDHLPVVDQHEAVGHAVRATYMYVPLADIAALTGEGPYRQALDAIWQDATYRKTYITGGIGSIRFHEQFGGAYELPNLSAWNETCASYGSVLWNHRMFLLHRDARYIDMMERVLYNGFLVGVSARGDRFFYQNPLTSYGSYERFDWINVPCCPPNVVRLLASLDGYIYAKSNAGEDVYVNLFVGSTAEFPARGTKVRLRQETKYPWDGRVRISVDPERTERFTIHVRIPGWTGDRVIPGDLYRFLDDSREAVQIAVNGRRQDVRPARGYAPLQRRWSPGDVIELTLPMPVRRVVADTRVRDNDGRVALTRGPLVYAAEWPDNGGQALNILAPDDALFTSRFEAGLLNGMQVVTGTVAALKRSPDGGISRQSHSLVAIPYYAWANRGAGEMQVWLPRTAAKARPAPVLPPESVAAVRSSGGIPKQWTGYNDQNDDIVAVHDGVDPLSSADESNLYFRMRPPVGQPAWIEYEFKQPTRISRAEVYWVDDRRFCRLPESWRVVYRSADGWVPVSTREAYGVKKDTFNTITFDPVTTTAIRIEVEPKTVHYRSGEIGPPAAMFLSEPVDWREFGIIEWRVR